MIFPSEIHPFPKFSGKTDFGPKNPGPSGLSAGKISGFSTFKPKKNPAGKISIQLFLRFSTFAAKIFRPGKFRSQKSPGFLLPWPRPYPGIYDGEVS
jgi:hypothetical protein